MKIDNKTRPNDIQKLQDIILELQSQLEKAEQENQAWADKYQLLVEQLTLAQQKRFGSSSEAAAPEEIVFNEAENIVDAEDKFEAEKPEPSNKNKPKGRPKLPAALPREDYIIDVPEAEQVCDCCHQAMHKMGEEVSEKLEFIPAQLKVLRHIRPKYSCRFCEQQGTEVQIKIAAPEPAIIPKGNATPSLLSTIISNKFLYGVPLYRQESWFEQAKISLSRQTMSRWIFDTSDAAKPLVALLKTHLLQQANIHADETTLKVIEDHRSKSYMWVYCCGHDQPQPGDKTPGIVLYDYQEGSRSAQAPIDYLQGFDGYLHSDGYCAYEKTDATIVGCMAHARRKFVDAKKANPKGQSGKADWAINLIQKLYRIETQHKNSSAQVRFEARQEHAKPLLDKFKLWLDKSAEQVPPKSYTGTAITYALNQWSKLIVYLEDGHLKIDNNRAERAVKPFVIGRKNWLFSNTHSGANSSAILYSLVETAKANGLIVADYLTHIFKELPKLETGACLEHLLPWNVTLSVDTG